MPENTIMQNAQVAVEEKLGLRPIIDAHERDYLDTLIGAHREAKGAFINSDFAFFAEVIPWVASLIQVFTSQNCFADAIAWTKKEYEDTSRPISILTLLTTAYLVQRGCERSEGTAQAEVWKEISNRLDTLLQDEVGHDTHDPLKQEAHRDNVQEIGNAQKISSTNHLVAR